MMSLIYLAKCVSRDSKILIYIGKTHQPLEERIEQHKQKARQNDPALFHQAMINHGVENFEWIVLVECDFSEEAQKEQEYIDKFSEETRLNPNLILLNIAGARKEQRKSEQKTITHSPFIKKKIRHCEKSKLGKICLVDSGRLKPVQNLRTGHDYASITEAAKFDNVTRSAIKISCETGKQLKDGSRYAYRDINGDLVFKEGHEKNIFVGRTTCKIKNLVNGKIYNNAKQAEKEYGVSAGVIAYAAAGKYGIIKKQFVFCFLDENDNEILKKKHLIALEKIENKDKDKFVAYHVGDLKFEHPRYFKSISEIVDDLKIKNPGHIKSVCDGKRSHVEGWRIAYFDPLNKKPIFKDKHLSSPQKIIRRVICLDDKKIFLNCSHAGKYYGIGASQIGNCIRGKQKSAYCLHEGTKHKKRLRFAEVDSLGNPIFTVVHKASEASLAARGKKRIMLLDDGAGKARIFNSLAEYCRVTGISRKRAKKFINNPEINLFGNEFTVLD